VIYVTLNIKIYLTLVLICLVVNFSCKKKGLSEPELPEVKLYTDGQVILENGCTKA